MQQHKEPSFSPQNPNPIPNPQQTMQAFHFIRLLARMNNSRSNVVTSTAVAGRRSHNVRVAAFASMAFAVGPRRVWSRALLRSLRRRGGTRSFGPSRVRRGNRANELRRLVPGGRRMDICSLLEETGDYIKCLLSQVKVMKRIADSCESSKKL